MSCALRCAVFALGLFLLGSCASAPDPKTQSLVDSLVGKHGNVVRLTVHAIPAGGTEYQAVASSLASKRGKASDPEDLKAMHEGEIVVLDEPGGIDVTVPILEKDGKHTAAAGVTLKNVMGREAAIVAAKAIAMEIDVALSNAAMKKMNK
jgi:hypothetical protein